MYVTDLRQMRPDAGTRAFNKYRPQEAAARISLGAGTPSAPGARGFTPSKTRTSKHSASEPSEPPRARSTIFGSDPSRTSAVRVVSLSEHALQASARGCYGQGAKPCTPEGRLPGLSALAMARTTQSFPYPERAVRTAPTGGERRNPILGTGGGSDYGPEPATLASPSVGVGGKAFNPITGLG